MKLVFALGLVVAGAGNALAQSNWVSIINDANAPIVELYASNQDQNNWGPNWFGGSMLPAYSDVAINLDDGTEFCIWDLKAVFANGGEVTMMGMNVCEAHSWRVY